MTIDSDFHSHVSRSSARAMVEEAQRRGLRVFGLSEHDFQMIEARLLLGHLGPEGPLLTFESYIESVHEAAKDAPLIVCLGMEVDFIPGKNGAIQEMLRPYPWDFLIGSVHEVAGVQFERIGDLTREEGEARWLRYFSLLREAVTSGYFDVVSHPVRMRLKNPHLPATFDDELEHLAAEAARCDVALEINGYDMLTYPDLVLRLARACALHKTPISVSSDAHRPREVAQAHRQSEEILREVGISTIRFWRKRAAEEYNWEIPAQ